jgi:acyl-CoA thioester hydrolase
VAQRQSLEPSRQPGDYTFVHRLRTRFAETDAMGIVHHAAYLPYLEEARVEYLRHLGHPYSEVRQDGHNFAVLEVSCSTADLSCSMKSSTSMSTRAR